MSHEEIKLFHPFPNGSDGDKVHPDGQKFIDLFDEMAEVQKRGDPIYIKILEGEREGSITKFISDPTYGEENKYFSVVWHVRPRLFGDGKRVMYETKGIYGHFIWDGRKNKVQARINPSFKGQEKYAWLKNYEGPTIYKRINKKEIIKKEIESTPQKDIDGKKLKVGDKVLYCNIRYGGGTTLCKGTIKDFKGKAQTIRKKTEVSIYTIILNEDGEEESKIENSCLMVKKFKW